MRKRSQRIGVECKCADALRVTASMRIAANDLQLDALYVLYLGLDRSKLEDGIEAVPLYSMLPDS